MGKTKFDETYIFKISIKCDSFGVAIDIKIQFLEFWLLLSRVAPYYSSLPRTVLSLRYDLLDTRDCYLLSHSFLCKIYVNKCIRK